MPRKGFTVEILQVVLNRITIILGLVWVTCIVVLGLITKFDAGI
jgi:preprotein translocase subunit SecG